MEKLKYTHEDYTIGWVCALPGEQAAALFMLDERHEDLPNPSNDHNAYTLGGIDKHKVVIAGLPKGRYGNNSSATVAARMVSTFPNIRVGLMVGIGGGIPQKTRLGDVVISCPSGSEPGVVQWDMGKAEYGGEFKRTGSLAPPPTALLTALGKFEADQIASRTKMLSYLARLRSLSNVPKSFLKSDALKDVLYDPKYRHKQEREDCSHCDERMTVQREPREDDMVIHCGLIASGNQVIKDAVLRDKLYQNFDQNVLCIEMEAAGLMNDFPCIVIRGICDYADSHKNKRWQNYAAAVAAACAKAYLTVVPASDVDKLQRVQLSITPDVLQSAKETYMAFFRGDKKDTATLPSAMASPEDRENYGQDGASQTPVSPTPVSPTPAPEMMRPRDKTSVTKLTESTSNAKPRETSPGGSPPMQSLVESWLREASSSLATMVQEGRVDAAMRNIIMNLSQLQVMREGIPQEGMLAPQDGSWNNRPQTPTMLPQRGVYADGEDDGYGRDGHSLGARSGTFLQTQPCPRCNYRDGTLFAWSQAFPSDLQFNTAAATRIQQPEKPRTNSYHADNSERDDDCPRSQSQSPVSSRGRDDPDRGANGYLWYGDDHSVSTDESQERPHPSQPSSNMNKTRPRSDNGSQRQRSADTNWNNESTSLSKTREYLSQAFFSAVKNADIPAIKRLLDNGADLEMLDRFGRTPLWCAAEMGRRDVIQLLLDEHADTEAQNAHGQTILAWAVENHRNEIIDMLGFS